jgi:hypothetical protein
MSVAGTALASSKPRRRALLACTVHPAAGSPLASKLRNVLQAFGFWRAARGGKGVSLVDLPFGGSRKAFDASQELI